MCAFSIKFNKHTKWKWVEMKLSEEASAATVMGDEKRKQFNKIHLFPYCQISLFAFMLSNCSVASVSRSSSRNGNKRRRKESVLTVIFSLVVVCVGARARFLHLFSTLISSYICIRWVSGTKANNLPICALQLLFGAKSTGFLNIYKAFCILSDPY